MARPAICSRQFGRLGNIESQVGLTNLGHSPIHPVPAPCNWEVDSGRDHQVDIRRKEFNQPGEIGQEDGVRDVVQVVENDDDFWKICHLHSELLQQGGAQSAPVHDNQRAESGELGPDGAQSAQESSREMDWIIVNGFDLKPYEVQVGMAGRPLG